MFFLFIRARALADVEEYEEDGIVLQRVVKPRETRLPTLITHVLLLATAIFMGDLLRTLPVAIMCVPGI